MSIFSSAFVIIHGSQTNKIDECQRQPSSSCSEQEERNQSNVHRYMKMLILTLHCIKTYSKKERKSWKYIKTRKKHDSNFVIASYGFILFWLKRLLRKLDCSNTFMHLQVSLWALHKIVTQNWHWYCNDLLDTINLQGGLRDAVNVILWIYHSTASIFLDNVCDPSYSGIYLPD